MIPFYPFMYEQKSKNKKKDKFEQQPLYIELDIPTIPYKEEPEEEKPTIIIVEVT